MSYDVSLELPECSHCGRRGEVVHDENMTSNVSGIWARALAVATGKNFDAEADKWWGVSDSRVGMGGFGPLEGIPGKQAGPACLIAADHITGHPELYREFEPDNGWGSAAGAAEFLRKLGQRWLEYPDATIRVSR